MRGRYDVAIVGCGPVGQTLAILLAQKGWNVGVFEKQPLPYPLPRAVHFDHETGRILQAVGIAASVSGRTEAANVYEWRNAAGETLLRFDTQDDGVSGWPESNMFAQPEIERLLEERAGILLPIELRRGQEVVGLDVDGAPVRMTVATAEGQRVEVSADFVVGCDGANSFVRQHLGATVSDLGFFFDWLIVDVVPREPQRWDPVNIQICDPLRPTTLVSGGPGRRRWEFMRLPGEDVDKLNRESTAWRLLEPWGVTRENAKLERHTVYRFQARWVDTWRRGRLMIAGDAAHQMPPFAGQGMCSGMRDAMNLGWKLDLVLAGKASEDILDSYASERVPHVRAIIDLSMSLGRVICIADPAEAAARDAAMIAARQSGEQSTPMPSLDIGPGLRLEGDPLAGKLFVQGRVTRGHTSGRFDDVVGGGWLLLGRSADPAAELSAESRRYLESLGAFIVQVGEQTEVRDVDGTYARWFDAAGVAVVLQRPDFYVFGTAKQVADVNALVEELRRRLGK